VTSDEVTGVAEVDWRAALEGAGEGVCALDGEGRFTYVNVAAERLLGRGREELLGRVLFDALPELAASMFYTDLHRALLEREPVEAEEFFAPLGRWLVSRVRPIDGGLHVYFADVTDLRRAESERDEARAALRASEELYQGFIAGCADAIGRFELVRPLPPDTPVEEQIDLLYADAQLAECNAALARLYGFDSAEEALGARLGTFMPGTEALHIEVLRRFIQCGYRLAAGRLALTGSEGTLAAQLIGRLEDGQLVRLWTIFRPAPG
jgi:PAS domain S-box-containing protein